ncbi:MAG: flagellar hook-associated protein FlgL [Planctomycetota bacterium]|jgi:flagellar hook-associated protein 3 FlgL|nr:flagellar hook-associated protein FlgL [Planctomycetota bacterium]
MPSITLLGRTMNVMADNRRNLERASMLQSDLSSGKRVRTTSDDPTAARRAMALRVDQFRNQSYTENISRSLATMNVADSVFSEMAALFDEAKSVAVEGANATQDATSRRALADSVDAQLDRLVELGNQRHEGRFLFSGTSVTTKPLEWNADRSAVVYKGDLDDVSVNIAPSSNAPVLTNGHKIFKQDTDVFAGLIELRDALRANDQGRVGGAIDGLDAAHAQLAGSHGELGSRVQRFELSRSQLEEMDTQLQTLISEQLDTDMATTIMELQSAQVTLEAGLNTSARILQPSLLDFL